MTQTPGPAGIDARIDERALGWLLAAVLLVGFGLRMWMALVLPPYFDDRYICENILRFLDGSLRPKHAYYGSLSYLPQALALALCDRLHSLTGIDALAVRGDYFEGFTLGAFRIMRTFVIGYALLSVLTIYFVGRRLFSPTIGLVAAAVLAAYPQTVRSAIQLKPDMMALLFTAVTLSWTAAAVRSPRLSRFLLAGVGVGLATAAKYIGVAASIPLTLWALWTGFRDRRRWAWLPLAGVASVATFFALNPFLGTVLPYASRLATFYATRARGERGHLVVLRREIEFLAFQHGWVLGAFLLLGTALLARELWRKPEGGERTAAYAAYAGLLPLSLYLGYTALYAAGMTIFRTHNLLPAVAGTALVCAFGLVHCGRWLAAHRPAANSPAVAFAALLLTVGLLLARPFHYTYQRAVPLTWEIAERALRERLAPLRTRHLAREPVRAPLNPAEGWRLAIKTAVPSLAALSSAQLDMTDAEAFPLSRSQGPAGDFYRRRRQRVAQECVLEIHPRPFRSRGTPLLLILHPWTAMGKAVPLDLQSLRGRPRRLAARLPSQLAAGDVVSVELTRPSDERVPAVLLLRPGGQTVPFEYSGRRRERARFLTPRFRLPGGVAEVQVTASGRARPQQFQLRLWRWTRPAC